MAEEGASVLAKKSKMARMSAQPETQPENELIIDGEHDADNRGTQRPANTAKHPRATKFEITATADFLDKCLYCGRTGVKTKA